MALTTTPYCAPDEVKALLDLSSSAKDALIEVLIEEAQSYIDEAIGYSFQSETATRTFDGNGLDFLMVGDIASFTTITEDGLDITTDCVIGPYNRTPGWKIVRKTQVLPGLAMLIPPNIDDIGFSEGRQNIVVTGTWGYTIVPAWCQRVTKRLVVHWFKMMDTDYSDYMFEQGGIRQKYNKDVPDDIKAILAVKRRVSFAARS